MIALLTGLLATLEEDHVIIDVQGVGYQALVSAQTAKCLPQPGATVRLYIHTHVREDQLCLFGFATREERALFQRLLAVSGIGPKSALALLSGLSTPDLVQAVIGEDARQLATIPGIGKKTAERIVIDLRDRLLKDQVLVNLPSAGTDRSTGINHDALSALLNLGYARQVAEPAVRTAQQRSHGATLSGLIREALKELATR
ncbi:MAG: Holliday junction branch migration protein RuvA [Deltaproteobacteria bacterium]|nr:Holliday junction branch migration protein RuvA [Deltaproteobacteria bacterium]